MESENPELYKLVLIGSSGSGKTNLILRFAEDTFTTSHLSTIGIDFKVKTISGDFNKPIKLQLWDTAGQERFRAITNAYYRGASGMILVYDITDKHSLTEIETVWSKNVQNYASPDVVTVLVGNKCDLEADRQVSFQEGQDLADKLGMKFFETSAKDVVNIDSPFFAIVDILHKKVEDRDPIKTTHRIINGEAIWMSAARAGKIISLKTSFKDLYLDTSFTDVTFEVENEEIHCHKVVLAKGCKFFHNLFTSEMKEANSKIIKIEDVKAQTFKVLLAYLYSADDITIDESTALELISLADKYLLPDLRKEGERVLSTFLSADNFLKYVELSEKLGESFLNEAVIKFILANYETLKDRDEFYELPKIVLRQVMSSLKPK